MVNASLVFEEPTPLSSSTVDGLRRRLSAARVAHLERIVALEESADPEAAITVEWDLDAAVAARLRTTLREVDAALGRMEAGTYGRCQSCGRPLPLSRLEAVPHARWCVTCATASAPLGPRARR